MTDKLFRQPLLWLAPLAGYTDQAFRGLCKHWGAEVMLSEMVSADGLVRDSAKTEFLLRFHATFWPRPPYLGQGN